MGRTLTTAVAARAVGVAPTTLQKYAQQGRVPFNVTPGGHRRFDPAEVVAALRSTPTVLGLRGIIEAWLRSIPEGLRPPHMSIFGSVARGDQGADSDIDLLVVRPPGVTYGHRDWANARARIILAVHRELGRSLDVLDLSEDDLPRLAATSPGLAEQLCAQGVVVHGKALGDLCQALDMSP